jgi:cell fate (sporulation/competence/biofilm development) regulator YlbF (YheA/YmcA/DUF963 family)
MADEEMVEPDEKDLKIKSLESELEQHKKLFNIHRAGLQPYLDGIVKEIVSKLHIVYKEK